MRHCTLIAIHISRWERAMVCSAFHTIIVYKVLVFVVDVDVAGGGVVVSIDLFMVLLCIFDSLEIRSIWEARVAWLKRQRQSKREICQPIKFLESMYISGQALICFWCDDFDGCFVVVITGTILLIYNDPKASGITLYPSNYGCHRVLWLWQPPDMIYSLHATLRYAFKCTKEARHFTATNTKKKKHKQNTYTKNGTATRNWDMRKCAFCVSAFHFAWIFRCAPLFAWFSTCKLDKVNENMDNRHAV